MSRQKPLSRTSSMARGVILIVLAMNVEAQRPPAEDFTLGQLTEESRLEMQWSRGTDARELIRKLVAYRKKQGPSPNIDYMLATSYCRVPETRHEGARLFRWMLRFYRLDLPSRRILKWSLDLVQVHPGKSAAIPLAFYRRANRWVAAPARYLGTFLRTLEVSSPFDRAIESGSTEMVRYNWERSTPTKESLRRALMVAAMRRDRDGAPILRFLLDHGASAQGRDGAETLLQAARLGSASSVAILIAYGADLKTSLGSSNSFNVGVAALICSAHRDDEEATPIIQLLLEKGVKLNKRGAYGCDTTRPKDSKVEGDTALLAAARSGTAGTIRLLLEGGAKVNVRFSDPSVATGSDQSKGVSGRSNFAYDIIEDGVYETGSTPLIFAAGRIDPDSHMIVKMLIGSGASVKGRDGAKALISAGAAGNIQTVQQLLRAGAIIDAQDEFGTTALMSAAEYGEADVVGFLVNHGADRHLENRAQQTALQVAIQYGYADIQALLVGENSPGKLR